MSKHVEAVLAAIDIAVANFVPEPSYPRLATPPRLLAAADALAGLPEPTRAAAIQTHVSAMGYPYPAVDPLPGTTLFHRDWDSGAPGSGGYQTFTRIELPTGRLAYVESVFNLGWDVDGPGLDSDQFLLAGTAGPAESGDDLEFVHALFCTSGAVFHRWFYPVFNTISTPLSRRDLIDLYMLVDIEEFRLEEVHLFSVGNEVSP